MNIRNTLMEAAFAAQGVIKIEVRFNAALSEFLNNGGSIERAHALIDAVAEKMGSEAEINAPQGHFRIASASLPNESAGQATGADKAVRALPALSTERSGGHRTRADTAKPGLPPAATKRNGAGQMARADKAMVSQPRPVSPAYIDAAKTGAKALAVKQLGWLGDAHIPGGPKFTQLRWRDIDGMVERQIAEGATHARAAIALGMIRKAGLDIGQVDPEALWSETLPAETVVAISRATEAETLKPIAVGWLKGLSNSMQEVNHAR